MSCVTLRVCGTNPSGLLMQAPCNAKVKIGLGWVGVTNISDSSFSLLLQN